MPLRAGPVCKKAAGEAQFFEPRHRTVVIVAQVLEKYEVLNPFGFDRPANRHTGTNDRNNLEPVIAELGNMQHALPLGAAEAFGRKHVEQANRPVFLSHAFCAGACQIAVRYQCGRDS